MLFGFILLDGYFQWGWGKSQVKYSSLITFIILGNFAHNFMSYWQLFRVAEFKEWTRQYRFAQLNIWQIIVLTYLIFIGLIYGVLPADFNTFSMRFGTDVQINAIIFLFFVVNTHHNLAQMKGIGLSHTHHYLKSSTNEISELVAKIDRAERHFYRILMVDWLVFMGWVFLLNKTFQTEFLIARVIFLIGLFVHLARLYAKLPSGQARVKLLFSLRHVYRLFFGLHPAIAFFAFAIHGADAMLIYWKSLQKSKGANVRFLKFEFIAFYLLLAVVSIVVTKSKAPHIGRLFVGLFLTHYVVEGFFYRMKNPLTRKMIGPLL